MTYEGETGTAQAARQEASGVASTARDQAGNVATATKEHAREVGDVAREQAHDVAGTAREQVHEVVGEAKDRARDVAGDVREEVRRRADEQGVRAAGALHETGRHLRSMADASDGDDMVTGLVHQAADQVESLAARLDNGGVDRLMADVRDYARRKPGSFLLAAGVAGFVAGRLARNVNGLTSGSDATSGGSGGSGDGRQFTATPYAPSTTSPAQPSLTGLGVEPTAAPTFGAGLGTQQPAEAEMPYLGGATPPPEVFGEGTR